MTVDSFKAQKALLGVAIETGFLHGVDGVPQKLMGILLAPKAKVSGDFCGRPKCALDFCQFRYEKMNEN